MLRHRAAVEISNDAFHPAKLTIAAGQTVTFTNRDDDAHTVTASDGAFDSKGIDTGQTWRSHVQQARNATRTSASCIRS